MAYMYSCCFYFSLRLGSIIVGFLTMIQTIIVVTLLGIALDNPKTVSDQAKTWKDENDLIFLTSFFENFILDPNKYSLNMLIFHSLHTVFCVMLIYGAYMKKTIFMYPFVVFEVIRLLGLFACHFVGMMIVKENVIDLGVLIGLSVFGGFILLGMFYMLFCTISLIQVIKELIREMEITDISIYPKNPVPMTDVYTIRNKFFYN